MGIVSRREFLLRGAAAALATAGFAGATSPSSALWRLRRHLHPNDGVLLFPNSVPYEARRRGFNLRMESTPAAILLCHSQVAVQQAIAWSRESGVPLHLRSGGHSYEGFNNGAGLLVDLSGLKQIEIDTARRLVRVQGGVKQGALRWALAQQNFVLPGGTCPSVGIAGLTLGGGYGLMSRRLGLTCDNLLELTMIGAQGGEHRADLQNETDLFWASRGGGGGNFGVVTDLTFRLRPTTSVGTFRLRWPAHQMSEVLQAWQRWAPEAARALTCRLLLNARAGAGIDSVIASGMYLPENCGVMDQEAELLNLLRPLTTLGHPEIQVQCADIRHSADFADVPTPPNYFKGKSDFVAEPFDSAAISTLEHGLNTLQHGWMVIILSPGGGALRDLGTAATAHVHRQALFGIQYFSSWDQAAQTPDYLQAMGQVHARLRPYVTGGAYVNYADVELENWADAYHGANLSRLLRVKALYDPSGFFKGGHGLPAP